MITNQYPAKQAANDWWDKPTPDSWKKHYKEVVDDYLVTKRLGPDELPPSKQTCKELIPALAILIDEWKNFDTGDFNTAYSAHKDLYTTIYNHLGALSTDKLKKEEVEEA